MPTHLITGAGSGIGEAVARTLRDRGDRLLLLSRSGERAAQLAAEFPDAETIVADLADPAGLEQVLTRADLPDRLDSLLHVAGAVELSAVAALPVGQLREQLDVNLVAPAVLTRACLPALRGAQGTVVFVNSTSGLRANPAWSAYAASKFGLRGFADALRAEEAEHGVRVTSVFPSRTATPMQEKVHDQEGKDYDASDWITPETVADAIVHVLDVPPEATIPELVVKVAR
ncbi:MAG TPA: SDR family oxidoreductase [Nocardioides sp.]|jgi:short-subunit dehydrogenase|nr:SDR family oxidoreductase [Nocardioides sp.]